LIKFNERNKTAKIGDKHGWDTVSEYEGNPLADDSDDERRLRQAETRAIRKRKAATPRNNPNVWRRTNFFLAFANHLRDKTSCQEPNLHLDSTTRGIPLSPPPHEKSQLPKTFVTTVVQPDTGPTFVPKKNQQESRQQY
jgi:hypothetical protein